MVYFRPPNPPLLDISTLKEHQNIWKYARVSQVSDLGITVEIYEKIFGSNTHKQPTDTQNIAQYYFTLELTYVGIFPVYSGMLLIFTNL